MSVGELPIGRRVAQWRLRRRMSQQMFADRIGKSKSWVDKVERGVRSLDRFSVIEEIAEVLRVDPVVLLGREAGPAAPAAGVVDGLDGVRAALSRYEVFGGVRPGPTTNEVARQVGHAWLSYQHAHYPQLVRMLPGLVDVARRLHARRPDDGAELLVQAYRITSSLLVKLGEPDLGWLAADRAVAVAGGDPVLAATAVVPLGQALRALGWHRLAMAATVTAAHRVTPVGPGDGSPQQVAVAGALLLQAALAAAGRGDPHGVTELVARAADLAERGGPGHDRHVLGFGPVAVELVRVLTTVELGRPGDARERHLAVTADPGWRLLPAEHRAGHLLDLARAYLKLGDLAEAGRLLVEADRTAPAEVRCRPAARTVVAEVHRDAPDVVGVARLATAIGLLR
ncbi:helix-turn-helix domain-containing protein [Micromonospora sp. WMMD882]|uniref:helix-turn-helix domain-containing protein n=1 Tax=Micromonospora sp. WMMD882 TaxID=3015151 RepID=UPI00248C69E6|nr:helix-turn-helix domain-containing protein [Micromonospora sp. WMMD882]WBB80728.1 helix-turn-helix domain-containing protein [Micromonospora sp. WMMD882]